MFRKLKLELLELSESLLACVVLLPHVANPVSLCLSYLFYAAERAVTCSSSQKRHIISQGLCPT